MNLLLAPFQGPLNDAQHMLGHNRQQWVVTGVESAEVDGSLTVLFLIGRTLLGTVLLVDVEQIPLMWVGLGRSLGNLPLAAQALH